MKKIFSSLCLLILSTSVFAWTIGPMNYQGRLLDAAGIPVTGSYTFKVRIYDAASGGVLKFEEQHNSVAVNDGVYAILVSTGSTLSGTWDINLWNTPSLYLEAEVNGQTLTPRHLLAATPFAYQANLALTTNNALALGGQTASNILSNICASTKGKWLDLAQKCLGVGTLFPGPTLVSWSTLSTSNDFSNLDLSKADISGIDFTGATLAATVFKQTTYAVQGLGNADLSNSVWDAAVATDAAAYPLTGNLFGATFKNMKMNRWNLAGVLDMSNVSAAFIGYAGGGCPIAYPAQWTCRAQKPTIPANKRYYFLLGPNANLSATSALAVNPGDGVSTLPVDDQGTLNNCGDSSCSLAGADFSGLQITQNFNGSDLTNAKFDYTLITGNNSNLQWSWPAVTGASFTRSKLVNISFGGLVQGASFSFADLRYVHFNAGAAGNTFFVAILDHVTFSNASSNNFRHGVLDTVTATTSDGLNAIPAEVYNVVGLP